MRREASLRAFSSRIGAIAVVIVLPGCLDDDDPGGADEDNGTTIWLDVVGENRGSKNLQVWFNLSSPSGATVLSERRGVPAGSVTNWTLEVAEDGIYKGLLTWRVQGEGADPVTGERAWHGSSSAFSVARGGCAEGGTYRFEAWAAYYREGLVQPEEGLQGYGTLYPCK